MHFWVLIAGFVCHQGAAADALLGRFFRMYATLLQSGCVLLLLHWFTKFLSSVVAVAYWLIAKWGGKYFKSLTCRFWSWSIFGLLQRGVGSTSNHSHADFGLGQSWSSGFAVGRNRVYSTLGEHDRPDSIVSTSEILVDLGFCPGNRAY